MEYLYLVGFFLVFVVAVTFDPIVKGIIRLMSLRVAKILLIITIIALFLLAIAIVGEKMN